jgi:hypothetical protein
MEVLERNEDAGGVSTRQDDGLARVSDGES